MICFIMGLWSHLICCTLWGSRSWLPITLLRLGKLLANVPWNKEHYAPFYLIILGALPCKCSLSWCLKSLKLFLLFKIIYAILIDKFHFPIFKGMTESMLNSFQNCFLLWLALWGLWMKTMLALNVKCWGLVFQVQVLKFVVSDMAF